MQKNSLEDNWAKTIEGINFGFASPGNPQKNGLVEQAFATTYSWMCSMTARIGLHDNLNTGICPKCPSTTNKLDIITANAQEDKYASEKFYGNSPDQKKNLNFCVNGSFTLYWQREIQARNWVMGCNLLRYARKQTCIKYHMFDLCTKFIVLIHDITWMNKTCGEYISRPENYKYDSYILED